MTLALLQCSQVPSQCWQPQLVVTPNQLQPLHLGTLYAACLKEQLKSYHMFGAHVQSFCLRAMCRFLPCGEAMH